MTSPSIIFIEGQHLGVLLPIAKDALLSADHTKRSRQRKFLELARLLRGLKLIPEKEGAMHIALGTNDSGTFGLLVHLHNSAPDVKAEGPMLLEKDK